MSKNTDISELINYVSVNGSGHVVFTTVPSAASNTDKFLVSDSGVLKFRTAAQLLSDIGAQASGNYQTALTNPVTGTGTANYLPKFIGSTSIANSLIFDNGTNVLIGTTTAPTPVAGVSFPLSVTSSAVTRIRIDSTQATPNSGFGLYANSVQKWSIAMFGTGSDFTIYNDALLASAILVKGASSNVLVGYGTSTADAGYKLDVNGTGRFSSNLYTSTKLYIATTAAYGFNINSEGNNGFYNRGGSTNAHTPFLLENSSGVLLFKVLGDGTSTFSNSVTAEGNYLINNPTASKKGYTYQSPASNWGPQVSGLYFTPNNAVDAQTTFTVELWNGLGSIITPLSIASTGAATFSSSVTAGTNFRTDGGSVQVGAGSNNYFTRISTAYNYPYVDSYFDSMAGTSYDGRLNFRIQKNGGSVDNVMTILPSGNVGISTASPGAILDVSHSAGTTNIIRVSNGPGNYRWRVDQLFSMVMTNASNVDTFSVNTSGDVQTLTGFQGRYYRIYETGAQRGGFYPYNIISGGGTDYSSIGLFSEGELYFASGGSANKRMVLTSPGNIRLFITPELDTKIEWFQTPANVVQARIWADGNPRLNAQVGGSGGVYLSSGATSWTGNSDERLKTINSNIENAVEKINTLRAVNFSWKSSVINKQNLGLIAQDIQKVLPQLIDEDKDGILGIRYTELIPVLVAAIQELKAENNLLKDRLDKNNIN